MLNNRVILLLLYIYLNAFANLEWGETCNKLFRRKVRFNPLACNFSYECKYYYVCIDYKCKRLPKVRW